MAIVFFKKPCAAYTALAAGLHTVFSKMIKAKERTKPGNTAIGEKQCRRDYDDDAANVCRVRLK